VGALLGDCRKGERDVSVRVPRCSYIERGVGFRLLFFWYGILRRLTRNRVAS
jgi:hypothetical protein